MSIRWCLLLLAAFFLSAAPGARALDQAAPSPEGRRIPQGHPPLPEAHAEAPIPQSAEFRQALRLDAFRRLAVQHNNQVKIVDSWARQSLQRMAHRQRINGQDPVYTALDMCVRPEYWATQNIIYVQAIPIRQQLAGFAESEAEGQRMMREGRISPLFLVRDDVTAFLRRLEAGNATLAQSVNDIRGALTNFATMHLSLLMVPPADPAGEWHSLHDLFADASAPPGTQPAPPVPGYTPQAAGKYAKVLQQLWRSWDRQDAAAVNAALSELATTLPTAQPHYPSTTRRSVEYWYTRTFSGTLVGVFYFAAMVLLLIAAAGAAPRMRRWGMGFLTLALLAHAAAMGVRWYLAGRIPIQNQFESVMGAALLACIIGYLLELYFRNGLFGMAMSFVGFLASTACLVVPFVWGRSIGEHIAPTAGILMTYWLYIHVNVVICSYGLIAASAALGGAYLLTQLWHWINPVVDPASATSDEMRGQIGLVMRQRRELLESFDGANVIVMRLAFLFLGAGIVFGALWADKSWGRPWGWDPKETFALVTWLVYLILIHVRFAAPATKGPATAALSVAGFAVMLFNWIGVNFLLVGLHSYA